VELSQFKTPNGNTVHALFQHDPDTGAVSAGDDITAAAVRKGLDDAGSEGMSIMHLTRCLTGLEHPSDAARKRVERWVKKLEESGDAEKVPGVSRGGGDGIRWRLTWR
jgi:DNA helicase TIP49 (TBP-interacting protein)